MRHAGSNIRRLRAAPALTALTAALLLAPGCATVSLDRADAPRPEQSALHDAAAELRRVFAEEGWGVAETPGMARRLTAMLLRGRDDVAADTASQDSQLDRYLAGLSAGEGAGVRLVADLERAAALTAAANAAAMAAHDAPDLPGAPLDLTDLTETESAAQTALRGARFFVDAAQATAPRLRPAEQAAIQAALEGLHAEAQTLTGHADAFAQRRRAMMAASS